MKGNLVAKHMNKFNRPSVHKSGNKVSQEPLEMDSEGCHICGSPKVLPNTIEQICKHCKEEHINE